MPDYSLGKIYMVYPKVEDPDEGDVYYGSTTNTLSRRMTEHRNKTQCKILFDKYGNKNCFIELVEEYPCETREQLNKKEGEYIRANKCINKLVPGRTRKEWRTDNYDKLSERDKQRYIDNRDKILEKQKKYRTENPDKILQYQKEYRTENADIIKEYRKQYYIENIDRIKQYTIDNLDKISERKKQKARCPHCNKEMCKDGIKTHIKLGRCRSLRQSVHTIAPELD